MPDRVHQFLNSWFGNVGSADLPSSDRTSFWFGGNEAVKAQLIQEFSPDFELATQGQLTEWEKTPRGRLALIILYDQFPRYLHRHSKEAFQYDGKAQELSRLGLEEKMDHAITLIERVFFYMPFVHSEDVNTQELSIQLYQELVSLSMRETTQIYQLFLGYAFAHFRVIKTYGRFPQRNQVLGRKSTEAELAFLKQT